MKNQNEDIKNELAYFYKVIKNLDIKDSIKQSKINEHETPLDEILYNQFSVGENMDKQSRASTGNSRLKIFFFRNFLPAIKFFCKLKASARTNFTWLD